jgi:hypothetical protein
MLFKGSSKIKGVLVLDSINRIIKENSTVEITKNNINAIDVKRAIDGGFLFPIGDGVDEDDYIIDVNENKENLKEENTVLIHNKGDNVLILGNIAIKPNCARYIERKFLKFANIDNRIKNGTIKVVSKNKVEKIKKLEIEENNEEIEENNEEIEENNEEIEENNEEDILSEIKKDDLSETKSVVWDFREQKTKEPIKVNLSGEIKQIEEDIENKEEEKQPVKKRRGRKKKINVDNENGNKIIKKRGRKKTIVSEEKKIVPVGEVKSEKTSVEASQHIDNKGEPVEKVSKVVENLIEKLGASQHLDADFGNAKKDYKDIINITTKDLPSKKVSQALESLIDELTNRKEGLSFVDKEQEIKRAMERKGLKKD